MLIRKQFPSVVAEGGDFLILLGFELDGLGDDQKKLGEMGARASRFVDAPEKYELCTAPVRTPRRCVPPYDARRVPSNNPTSCPLFGSSSIINCCSKRRGTFGRSFPFFGRPRLRRLRVLMCDASERADPALQSLLNLVKYAPPTPPRTPV